jgi:hypothetical protein
LTLDHYAQVVTELSEAAAAAKGVKYFPGKGAMKARWSRIGDDGDGPQTRREGL